LREEIESMISFVATIPYLASLGNEIVVRMDDEKCSDLFFKIQIFHVLSSYAFTLNRKCSILFAKRGVSCLLWASGIGYGRWYAGGIP
jgi:hypothetical protein